MAPTAASAAVHDNRQLLGRDYEDFAQSGAFAGLAASFWRAVTVAMGKEAPAEQYIGFVSPNYFEALGLRLVRGLLFALVARRREIGVRLALGASPGEASWAVMPDGLRYAAFGIAGGIVLAIPTTIIAQQNFPGAGGTDPMPFVFALAAVLLAAAVAAYLPARKAGRVQPAVALRHD